MFFTRCSQIAHLRKSFPVGGGGGRLGSSDPSVAMTARRPRAVWDTRAREGNTVAEAMKRRGGEAPWKVRSSYPGP